MSERRKYHRINIRLKARFMLQDGSEHVAETRDVSLGGVSFSARVVPYKGQRVVAYVADLGRIEGTAARVSKDGFAMTITGTCRHRDKLAEALTRTQLEKLEDRSFGRIIPKVRAGRLHTINAVHAVEVLNVSSGGAAVRSEVFIPLGTAIRLGEHAAIVLRVEDGIYAIAFERELDASAVNENMRFE